MLTPAGSSYRVWPVNGSCGGAGSRAGSRVEVGQSRFHNSTFFGQVEAQFGQLVTPHMYMTSRHLSVRRCPPACTETGPRKSNRFLPSSVRTYSAGRSSVCGLSQVCKVLVDERVDPVLVLLGGDGVGGGEDGEVAVSAGDFGGGSLCLFRCESLPFPDRRGGSIRAPL